METIIPMKIQINPCGCCGAKMKVVVLEDEHVPELEPVYYTLCDDCGATGSKRDTPFDAVAWSNGEMLEVSVAVRLEDEK